MLSALCLAFATAGGSALHQDPPPIIPVAARPEFQQVCLAVENALSKNDFDTAAREAKLLPKREFKLGWDDSALPALMRPKVMEMRTLEIERWSRIRGVKIDVVPSGDVNVHFVDVNPNGPQGIPSASVLTFGESPRLSVNIGLHRGKPPELVLAKDAYMEVDHAIGSYLGIADDPLPGTCMHRDDNPDKRAFGVSNAMLSLAAVNLAASEALEKNVSTKRPMRMESATAVISPAVIDEPPVQAGTKIPLNIKLTNGGNGTLHYDLMADCGCFSRVRPGDLPPGESITLAVNIDTTEYIGTAHHLLVLYTNDPKNPAVEIPVTFKSTPAYRFYRPQGDTLVVDQGSTSADILMVLPKDSELFPSKYQWDGMPGTVTLEKFDGTAPDPEMGEGPMPRNGYVFHVKPGALATGRSTGTLSVETGSRLFPVLRYTLNVQRGVVAVPDNAFLGEMSGVCRASFRVTRPGKPFQITAVESTSKWLKAVVKPLPGGCDYEVDVVYQGGASQGDFHATVQIHLSDPKQTHLDVTVTGSVP